MKPKKSENANLEKKRVLFLQIGLLISLSVALVAFEWSSNVEQKLIAERNDMIVMEEAVKIIREEVKKPEPKDEPKKKLNQDKIDIKKNDEKISDTLDIVDTDINEGDGIIIEPEDPVIDDVPIYIAQKMPKFRGGDIEDFQKWVQKKVNYTERAQELGLEGKVTMLFAIDENGALTDVKVKRGVDPLLDNEVVKVLEKSPKWTPAENNGFKVKLWYYLPVTFKINE